MEKARLLEEWNELPSIEVSSSSREPSPIVANEVEPPYLHVPAQLRSDKFLEYAQKAPALLKSALPGFLRSELYARKKKTSPTAWLVAMRGYAGCLVALDHMGGPPETWTVMEWPIIRCLGAGRAMPQVFFVTSGFVLAYQMLTFMRQRDQSSLLKRLTSLSFRRYLRLYLPVGIATLITMIFMRFHWILNPPCAYRETFLGQLGDWFVDWMDSSNPLHAMAGFWHPTVYRTHYIDQMWTIPLEFRGSMLIFACCTALAQLTPRARMTTCCIGVLMCFYWQVVWAGMFIGGMALAEVSLNRQERQDQTRRDLESSIRLPTTHTPAQKTSLLAYISRFTDSTPWYCFTLFVSLIILGQPNDCGVDGPFPYQYTYRLIPSWWSQYEEMVNNDHMGSFGHENFWFGIGSLILIYTLDGCQTFQIPFNWNFAQYLGEISFGIYALHNLMVWTLSQRVLRPTRSAVGNWFWFVEIATFYFIVFWAGDYFRRIDNKLVGWQHAVQKYLFIGWV